MRHTMRWFEPGAGSTDTKLFLGPNGEPHGLSPAERQELLQRVKRGGGAA
ncbi:hypothetical protein JNUCC64_00945 [Streptomyces sp. JNUCC 64]